ncbi:MAG: tRNA (adenine(22)-N(1))-methyltransferase [Mycoplasmoidaceae bacterium]
MLKTRINFIASLVDKCNIVLDIGSDHAKISKILIDENKASRVINVELNDGPLQNSINATKDAKYYNYIWNIKSNGFKEIYPSFFIDVCIIAGMGGQTIVEILNGSKVHKINKFILQANNNVEKLREWCWKNKWKISNEHLIKDNNIIYEIIVISKKNGYIPFNFNRKYFGKINLKLKSKLFIEKWNTEIAYLKNNENIYKKNIKLIKRIENILRK